MGLDVRSVACGDPARVELLHAVKSAQAADPFAPVTVVVPTNLAGVAVRRWLAGRGGVANVAVVTPAGLAAALGRRVVDAPVITTSVLGAAVRAALAGDAAAGGFFAAVADHPATESALSRLYTELRRAGPEGLDALGRAPSSRTRAVVALCRSIHERLGDHIDEHDLARAAIERLRHGDLNTVELGAVIVHAVDDLAPSALALLLALAEHTTVEILLSVTGAAEADAAIDELAARLAVGLGPVDLPRPRVDSVITASDSDDEVRAVVRELLARAEAGVPFHRMGVLYPLDEPYARIVREHLDAAGIPHNGPSTQRLSDTLVGRTLLRLLALEPSSLGRNEIVELLGSAPVRQPDGAQVPATAWDLLSRRAGVVGGLDDWHRKLTRYRDRVAGSHDEQRRDEPSAGARRRAQIELANVVRLRAFIDWLAARLAEVHPGASWHERARGARSLLVELLGPLPPQGWPDAESAAATRVLDALERLGGLDAVDPHPSARRFRDAVVAELDAPAGRVGRFGTGVVYGPLVSAATFDLDVVFVVGLAEGLCPAVIRDDSLLPERERQLAGAGALASRSQSSAAQHRTLLLALAAARERVLCVPRGDHRTGRTRLPSRWVLDAASELAGAAVGSNEFAELDHPSIRHVGSYVDGLRHGAASVDRAEYELRALDAWYCDGGDPVEHPLASATVVAGITAARARRSRAFTAYDGNLGSRAVPSPTAGVVLSASRLETWAACPFRYFLGNVLHLGELERPEAIVSIGALDRGSLVHAIFERFIGEVVARPVEQQPRPGQPWSPADVERLTVIAHELFDEYEAQGLTGRRVLWQVHREQILDDLLQFVDDDNQLRAESRAMPHAVELAFGLDGAPPAFVELPDGRTLAFRGLIDRVDRRADGSLVVLDYKTGRPRNYRGLTIDPVLAGTKLQLPLYAVAASQRFGATSAEAYYWFTSLEGEFDRIGYAITRTELERFESVLATIVDGIEGGVFPAVPGDYSIFWKTHDNCSHCDFDRLCPGDRGESWEATSAAPELELVVALDRVDGAGGGSP